MRRGFSRISGQGQPASQSDQSLQADSTEDVLSFPADPQLRVRFETAGN